MSSTEAAAAAPQSLPSTPMNGKSEQQKSFSLVLATRLHLGNASVPPDQQKLNLQVKKYLQFASSCSNVKAAIIAVDATPKLQHYDMVAAVQEAIHLAIQEEYEAKTINIQCHIVPIRPWGAFVTALNSIIIITSTHYDADLLMFVSIETNTPPSSVDILCNTVYDNYDTTLVAGALLPGHEYSGESSSDIKSTEEKQPTTISNVKKVVLNGCTTPWNTLAVWNVHKLAITGFSLVAEGLHKVPVPSKAKTEDSTVGGAATSSPKGECSNTGTTMTTVAAGVEEVATIAILQKVLGEDNAKARLVKLPGVQWDVHFDDNERRKWHENKMKSKLERADMQLQILKLSGWVYHG